MFYPSVTWVDALIARFALNTLTELMVTYLLITLILAFTETRIVLDAIPIIQAVMLAALLGLGVGTVNCFLLGVFPAWETLWSIASRPLFLASGIFFTFEDMPTVVQDFLWFNPLMHVTGIMRSGFFPMYHPTYVSPIYIIGVSMVLIVFGLIFLRRYHKDILNN